MHLIQYWRRGLPCWHLKEKKKKTNVIVIENVEDCNEKNASTFSSNSLTRQRISRADNDVNGSKLTHENL